MCSSILVRRDSERRKKGVEEWGESQDEKRKTTATVHVVKEGEGEMSADDPLWCPLKGTAEKKAVQLFGLFTCISQRDPTWRFPRFILTPL